MRLWSFRARILFLGGSSASVREVRYGRGLRVVMELMAKSGLYCHQCTFLSLLIRGATTLATREGRSDQPIRREGWWRHTQPKCTATVVPDYLEVGAVELYDTIRRF